MNLRFYIYWFAVISIISCSSKHNSINSSKQLVAASDTIKYAHGFSIHTIGGIKILHVFNPWEGAKGVEYKYILCHKNQQVPDSLKKWPIIQIPVKRIVCLSTTHIAVLSFLNRMNTLVGVSGPQYISDTLALKMISLGKVADVGYDQALNYEVIVSLHPDIVLAYGIQNEAATQYKKLEELGIKVVLNGEYLENTPLGKLEWVKYMATFFDASAEANQKFHSIEQEYHTLAHLCDNVRTKPNVMTGLPWKGAWYVPGGESYLSKMIQDAGGNYLWSDFPQRESIPLNFEKVIERSSKADIWINVGVTKSVGNVLAEDSRLGSLKPFKDKQLYNNNLRTSLQGGNDFWESGITHPQLILKDLIKIFHPELLPQHSLVYYKKLD